MSRGSPLGLEVLELVGVATRLLLVELVGDLVVFMPEHTREGFTVSNPLHSPQFVEDYTTTDPPFIGLSACQISADLG